MSDVAQLMRAANPVPDSEAALNNDEFDALLLLTQTRSGNVDVQELTKPVEPEKRQRSGWLVAAAAFAVVIVFVGAALLLASPADELPPATTPTTEAVTPTTVATVDETLEEATATTVAPVVESEPTVSDAELATIAAFETAWNEGDEAAFRALFAPGAVIVNPLLYNEQGLDVDWFVNYSAGRRAMETEFSIGGCKPSGESVICTAEFAGVVPIAMNTVPWRDRYIFGFDDGKITSIRDTCIICWDGDADERLTAWVETVDSSAATVLGYGYNLPETEEKALAWLEWAPKWQEAGRP